jgi:hypothetical protein
MMLLIKVNKKNENENFLKKLFNKNITDYFVSLFKKKKINIIDDSSSLEFIFSDEQKENEDQTIIEITYKKIITINNSELDDKQCLDKTISEIKNFCDQAVNVNNYVYLPLNMREKNNANTRTSPSRNRI